MQNQRKFDGEFMSKSKNNKKNKNVNDYLDMSYRKKIDIDTDQEYNDEELIALIVELNKQIQELNNQHKKLYSSNAYIERIYQRTFKDILHEKIISILKNIFSGKEQSITKKS